MGNLQMMMRMTGRSIEYVKMCNAVWMRENNYCTKRTKASLHHKT